MVRRTAIRTAATLAAVLLTAGSAAAGPSPAQKCKSGKLTALGKYSNCVLKAEKKLALTGDTAAHDAALSVCEGGYAAKWPIYEANVQCPSHGDQASIQGYLDSCVQDMTGELGGGVLPDCPGALASCTGSLSTCSGSLSTCTSNYGSCSSSLATAQAGTAVTADVLSGKTFSSSTGLGVAGTMVNRGAVTLTPSTADQAIAQGYHDGTGKCAGDADLVTANIRAGVNLFGVSGSSNVVNTSSGDAVASNILSGKKAWVAGALVTGNVPSGSNVTGADGALVTTVPNGLYAGSKTCTASDSNLVSTNIAQGVTIFGVTGTPNVVNTASGDAVAADMLSGKKAWVDGAEVTGNVPSGSNVSGGDGALVVTIPNGLYAGSKHTTASDSDLFSTNIRSGVTIFGVTGDSNVVNTGSGDAVATDLLTGKKAWVGGVEITGNVPSGSNVTGSDGHISVIIPDGLYAGSKTVTAGDSDLAAGNIRDGVSIFGVLGTYTLGGAPTPGAQPLQTGQTTCYDDGGAEVSCSILPGQDGDLQKGVVRAFSNNSDGTVTDDATQLQWERLADDGSIHDWDDVYSPGDAIAIKIAQLNADNFAGHSDWRLPNEFELMTLVNLGAISPATYPQFNTACAPDCTVETCTCTQQGNYLSSTSYLYEPAAEWTVNFIDGVMNAQLKAGGAYVRAVRTAS